MNPDVILIEGHKFEKFPKAVFIRNEEDVQLFEELEPKLNLYLSQNAASPDTRLSLLFNVMIQSYCNWLVNYILKNN